jgi:Flp pilus assembly pilin Flp
MPVPAKGVVAYTRAFWLDEAGQDLTEYAFLLAILALAIVVMLFNFRDTIAKVIGQATDCLNSIETNNPGTCPS